MNAGRLVVFSGIDGAGKSTQIRRLADRCSAEGTPVLVVWARIGYTPGMNLLRTLARNVLGARLVPPPGPGPARDQALARSWVRRWWLRLAMVDLLWYWGGWLRLCRLLGYRIICDRYWYDSQLDLRRNFPQDRAESGWLWRTVVRCCPEPDDAFLLLIPWDVYRQRSEQKREPFPLDHADFEWRRRYYATLENQEPWTVLDGLRSPDDLAASILAMLHQDQGSLSGC